MRPSPDPRAPHKLCKFRTPRYGTGQEGIGKKDMGFLRQTDRQTNPVDKSIRTRLPAVLFTMSTSLDTARCRRHRECAGLELDRNVPWMWSSLSQHKTYRQFYATQYMCKHALNLTLEESKAHRFLSHCLVTTCVYYSNDMQSCVL